MMDMFLHYRGTEGGARVYDMYAADDRATRLKCLGQVKIPDAKLEPARYMPGVRGHGTG